jgi:hypothetical protein
MTEQRAVPMALADLRALAGRYGAGTPGTHAEVDRCSRSEAAQPKGNSGLAEGGTPGTPGTPEIASVGGITATEVYCPSRPNPEDLFGAGEGREKSPQFGGFQDTSPNCPSRPKPIEYAPNAWDLTQIERTAALARLQPRTTPTDALDGLRRAALQHPPSWADATARPSPGCWCSCCKGHRWWCEVIAPKGWRCWQCHPPDHLGAEDARDVRT